MIFTSSGIAFAVLDVILVNQNLVWTFQSFAFNKQNTCGTSTIEWKLAALIDNKNVKPMQKY